MDGPTSHFYVSQRLRLHYVDWGNETAPPLLLVHGGRDHCRNWDWVAQRLRDRYHVIAPDLRGHGDSAWAVARPTPADAPVIATTSGSWVAVLIVTPVCEPAKGRPTKGPYHIPRPAHPMPRFPVSSPLVHGRDMRVRKPAVMSDEPSATDSGVRGYMVWARGWVQYLLPAVGALMNSRMG